MLEPNNPRIVFCAFASLITLTTGAFGAPEAFEVGPETKGQLPRGKEADGIIGDFVLRNNKVEAVISANLPLRRANMSTFYGTDGITPGCLYDLTPRGANNDQITVFAPANQRGYVSWVRVAQDGKDGEAVIETVLTAANNQGIHKRHEYRLRDDWQGIQIVTTFRNEDNAPRQVTTDDRWTTFLRTGTAHDITWADAVDPSDRAGYAYGIISGAEQISPGKSLELKPNQTVTFKRFLAVGHSPAEALGLVAALRGSTGTLTGRLRDRNGAPIPSAEIIVRAASTQNQTNPVAYPDNEGQFSFQVPAGEYALEFTDLGRASVKRAVTVKAGENVAIEAAMDLPAAVVFDIRDETGKNIPCKAQFHGIEGTPSPYLGPHNRAHGCVDQYHSEKGQFRVALPPGKYRIIVTRGIEYSHLLRTVDVSPGETLRISGALKRLVDTAGWISADYHNHSTPSGDNTCGTDDRITNLAAEHIEFAPTTEHNRLYDWRPHIERLGLAEEMQTVPGLELTGNGPHLNSFPFKPEPFTQDHGAPVWNPDPRISAILLRDWQGAEPDRWIQINHPDMVQNFIDHDADGHVEGGFAGLAQLIDGVETQNYRDSEILAGRPFRIGPDPAGKDSVFYIREFIQVQTEDGIFPGGNTQGRDGVKLKVKVQCTDWIDIDRVQVLVNGRQRKDLNFTRQSHAGFFGDGVVKFDRTIPVNLSADAHLIVVAIGEKHDLSIGYGTSPQAKVRPCAYHNPIFVDVDGGGFKPNGDSLGYNLPVKKLSVQDVRRRIDQAESSAN